MNILCTAVQRAAAGIARADHRLFAARPAVGVVLLSGVECLIIESLARRSPAAALEFFSKNPAALLCSWSILMLFLGLSFWSRRAGFVRFLVSFLWLGCGAANFVLLSFRTAPLMAIDFALLSSVRSIMFKYLDPFQLAAAAAAAVLVVYFLFETYRASRRWEVRRSFASSVLFATAAAVTVGAFSLSLSSGVRNSGLGVREAAEKYGYTPCFAFSFFDRGIDRPTGYSESNIKEVLAHIGDDPLVTPEVLPDVIFVQLESFFDVNQLVSADFEEDPLPNFNALREKYPSGELIVPSLATGTANTEFEVLTGMSLDFFGVGEYPYQTVLQTETCESMAYNMKALGYTAHAIHDHSGDFYDRKHVFSNLGFDTFTSVEYMYPVERNSIGWAKDRILTGEILDALDSTAGRDFVYCISVQAHGQYPDEAVDEMERSGGPEFETDLERAEAFRYYLSQIGEMDEFLGELLSALESRGEPTVLVLFGDHLPGLGLTEDDLKSGSLYQTQYVIWSNYGVTAPDRTLYAYQLSAYVQKLLGTNSGLFTRMHQKYADNLGYETAMELLEYDYLYGELEAFGGVDPYLPTDIVMGTKPIEILRLWYDGISLTVNGTGFTDDSRIYINGRGVETTVLSDETLFCPGAGLERGDEIQVAQISESSGEVLSITAPCVYTGSAVPVQ